MSPGGTGAQEEAAKLCPTAWAKVNLTLHVTGRRADGYHDLDSLVVFAGIGDSLSVGPSDRLSLTVEGPFARTLEAAGAGGSDAAADNLVLRAARALQVRFGVAHGANIRLIKRLPVAAGIGGGSADAAATLRALTALWRLPVQPDELAAIGSALGADVPVCLIGRPSFIGGKGDEIVETPRLPPAWLVLANPGVALSTAQVFARLGAPSGAAVPRLEAAPDIATLARYLARTRNDLEPAARHLVPEIGGLLDEIAASDGCLLSRMSGSGATCFGLYAAQATAEAAAKDFARVLPAAWVRAVPVRGDGL